MVVPLANTYQPLGVVTLDVHPDGRASGRLGDSAVSMAPRARRVPRPQGALFVGDPDVVVGTWLHPDRWIGDRAAATAIGQRIGQRLPAGCTPTISTPPGCGGCSIRKAGRGRRSTWEPRTAALPGAPGRAAAAVRRGGRRLPVVAGARRTRGGGLAGQRRSRRAMHRTCPTEPRPARHDSGPPTGEESGCPVSGVGRRPSCSPPHRPGAAQRTTARLSQPRSR